MNGTRSALHQVLPPVPRSCPSEYPRGTPPVKAAAAATQLIIVHMHMARSGTHSRALACMHVRTCACRAGGRAGGRAGMPGTLHQVSRCALACICIRISSSSADLTDDKLSWTTFSPSLAPMPPTSSGTPSLAPTAAPTLLPTLLPSDTPTAAPTHAPTTPSPTTSAPTDAPTPSPTFRCE